MLDLDLEWQRKRGSLSDTSVRKEFGLTQDEIVEAIRAGKLLFRRASAQGYPFLRLLRCQVEALVEAKHGGDYLKQQQAKAELGRVTRELKLLKVQVAVLEERRAWLLAENPNVAALPRRRA